jgi:hypothetical protein
MTFPGYLHQSATNAITAIPATDLPGIYAVSFFIYDQEDDPRRPTLTIGYNTEDRVQQVLTAQPGPGAGRPSDAAEARWNYAFWRQNKLTVIGDQTRDPAGARLCEAWIKDNGWWFSEPDGNAGEDWAPCLAAGERITSNFVSLCVRTARQLHADGVIKQTFGRHVPVLIHELEYYNQIADQTEEGNPPGLAEAFTTWIRNQ